MTRFDPFEPGYDAWPYDQYRRLREADPVHWSDLLCGWVLTRYDDVDRVLRDRTVSSDLARARPSPVVDLWMSRRRPREGDGMTLVLTDEPDHGRLRKLMQPPFSPRAVERLRSSIAERVDRYMAALAPRGAMELIGDFADPLPVEVFCEMLGIPDEAGPRFREWTAAVARSLDLVISDEDYAACMVLLAEMEEYLSEVADSKRGHPGDDVLSGLLAADVDGDRLGHDELIAQLVTLYVAGHEPTTALIGNGIAALLAHPEQLAWLQRHPEAIPGAVAELLRYDGPNQFVRRVAVEPMRFDGTGDGTPDPIVEPGDLLYLGVGAANHDPARWGDDADTLRVDRPDAAQHVQFGGGIHHCLGAHLARLQAEIALTALLTRLGDLRPGGEVTWSGRTTLRSVATVPLTWGG
ncbi:MAG TPA: cytochrome P450 [Acidimicrobiales bacterium]